MFFIQGVSQGVAVPFVPEDVFVICNLYGKCAKLSVVDVHPYEQCNLTRLDFLKVKLGIWN